MHSVRHAWFMIARDAWRSAQYLYTSVVFENVVFN